MALEENNLIGARDDLLESLLLNYDLLDIIGVTAGLLSMAMLATRLDKPLLAARLLGAVENRLETLSVNLLSLDQIELGAPAAF